MSTEDQGASSVRADVPSFDVAHQMQRLALDRAWQVYGHDDEHRERLVGWLREHGLAIWRLLRAAPPAAASPVEPSGLEAEGQALLDEWPHQAFAECSFQERVEAFIRAALRSGKNEAQHVEG